MRAIEGGVTAPSGFRASGLHCGIKANGKPDLSLIVSDLPASAAGVFTVNLAKAAPVFLSRVFPVSAIVASSSQRVPLDFLIGKPLAAFCGLGNPTSFWKTLEQLKCNTVSRWSFGDHHHYSPQELRRLEQQAVQEEAELLLTTQKDFLNLPTSWLEVTEHLPVYWLDVGMEVDNADKLLEAVSFQLKQDPLHI